MRSVWVSIFGHYQPVFDEVTGQVASGVASVDWAYILGGVCFIVCLYSFFKCVGVLLKNV